MMDGNTDRMPIACVHCAKAKAKCDKKVPCSRCVTKQVLCQSRPTRRSSNMASRRANAARTRPESFDSSARFRLSDLSHSGVNRGFTGSDLNLDVLGLMNRGCSFGTPQLGNHAFHRQSLPNIDYRVPFVGGDAMNEPEPQLIRNTFSDSPPDLSTSITPIEQDYPRLDDLMPMPDNWDQTAYDQLLAVGGEADLSAAFDMANILDFLGPQDITQSSCGFLRTGKRGSSHSFGYSDTGKTSPRTEASSFSRGPMELDYSPVSSYRSIVSDGSDGHVASQESWPFFSCNQSPKSGCFPPATAAIYVDGLHRVLTTHDWQIPLGVQHGSAELAIQDLLQGRKMIDSFNGHSTEALNSATQAILQKACTTHRTEQGSSLVGSSETLNENEESSKIQLPPPEAVARFIESYLAHHQPYYTCAADLTRSDVQMLQSNVQSSSLLTLLKVAQGAAFISIPAARYLSSGLTEACRLFLFDSIEKDILLSRDLTVLHSALLFTIAAAWSGDNWHMDIAMGQRGMYISMMSHARMFNAQEWLPNVDELLHNPTVFWEEWRSCEEKRRMAYSWVIVDQELSLFSDTAPLLNVVNLLAPMPSSESLWETQSADEWAVLYRDTVKDRRLDGSSLRDLFTYFVEGDLSSNDTKLSPLQLRLLLHPLQTLVCQLRQFLSCLPETGRQSLGTSISKVAIKARLEEILTMVRQWYGFTERHIDGDGKTCLTTRANLIMYHLISLNVRTSLGSIEQFARGEVDYAGARQASQWLHTHCIEDIEQVNFHCGQVLRLVRSIPQNQRPPWWSGAVYRTALIAWATSMARSAVRKPIDSTSDGDKPFIIDALGPEHPSIEQYLRYKEGMPMLSKRDGTLVGMSNPNYILQHCISVLEEDLSMRVTEGIVRKLQSLLDRWRNPPGL